MKFSPLVSVIIPTYNYGHVICQAIDSILNSDFPQHEIEIIVVDDGSTDGTSNRVEIYGENIQYIFQENSGKAEATKIGIEHAKGRYLFNLDADDFFLPNKIREVIAVFEKETSCVHVGHPAIYWNVLKGTQQAEVIPTELLGRKNSGREVLAWFYKKRVLFGGGSTFAARADILKAIPINRRIDMYIDEYLVLATLNKGDSYFIEEPLSIWRIHGENFSFTNTNGGIDLSRAARNQKGMKAVFASISGDDYDPIIKAIYGLKIKLSEIVAKERTGQKQISDILDLWSYVLKTSEVLGLDAFKVISLYGVFTRSLPSSVIKLLKQARSFYMENTGLENV